MSYYTLGWIVIVIAMILSVFAQAKIKSTFESYSRVYSSRGITGYQAARMLLDRHGLQGVQIQHVAGNLTDHYDPSSKTLRLSEAVYASTSIAAIGVAAHEVGHAIQDSENYVPLKIRNGIFPAVAFSSKAAIPIILIGFVLGNAGFVNIGIFIFSITVFFQIITLPVEFDASGRAIRELKNGIMPESEIGPVKKVLGAAALTYVAAALASLGTLLRFIGMRRRD